MLRILLAAFVVLAVAAPAQAHPHVWVTMHSELVYAPDGRITGIRHAWSFDDMFSTFASQGLESKEKGKFTREELAPLAKVNVESLKEYDYFTYATADGNKAELAEPTPDYWLDYTDQVLTLHFTLPFKTPVKAKELKVEIYDPTIFVDFSLAKDKPVQLGRRAAMQARCGPAARNDLCRRQEIERDSRRPEEYDDGVGRSVREQDSGTLSVGDASYGCAGRRAGTRFSAMILSGRRSTLAHCAFLVIGLLFLYAVIDAALAQPFGVTRAASPAEVGGFTGWILHKQAEFYRMLSG